MEYQEGKVYKIEGDGLTYYGSTTKSLNNRFGSHKRQKGCSSRQIIELGHATIVLVELFPCETLDELLWRERWWMENNECVNIVVPIVSEEERKKYVSQWYNAHKDERKKYNAQYRIENHKHLIELSHSYKEKNANKIREQNNKHYDCECGGAYIHINKARHFRTKMHKLYEKNKNLCIVHVSVK